MLSIIIWAIYGLVVGSVAKLLHRGPDPDGCLTAIGIGVAGSYIGGLLNYLFFGGDNLISASGMVMGVVGALIFLVIYNKVKGVWLK